MTRTTQRMSRSTRTSPMLNMWQVAGLGPLHWLAPTTVARMRDMGAEWLSFVADRVRDDVAFQHALLHAKSPADVQRLQVMFLQNAIEQYGAETGKMVELSSRIFDAEAEQDGPDTDNVNV